MAAMYLRSNTTSPQFQEQITNNFADIPRQQLREYILEAKQQTIAGASPAKIAAHHRFLDRDLTKRFSTSIIEEWVAIPDNALDDWLDAATVANVTIRRHSQLASSPRMYAPGFVDPVHATPTNLRSSHSSSPYPAHFELQYDSTDDQARLSAQPHTPASPAA